MTEPIGYKDDGEMLVGSKTLKGSFSGVNAKLTTSSPSLKEEWCVKEYDPNAQPDYSKMYFIFQFKDGETAKYRMDKDCHNLQQFLDRMNKFHELEKENKRLKKQLRDANEVISDFRTYDFTVDGENAEAYQVKWKVKAKRFYKNRKWV